MSSVSAVSIFNAIIAILIGLVSCFFGYRFFRIVLGLVGFIVGFGICAALVPDNQVVLQVALGVIIGIVCGLIFYWLYVFGLVIAGAILGATLATTALLAFNMENNAVLGVAALVGLIVGALVTLLLNKWIIVASTAFNGAAIVLYGVSLLIPGMIRLDPGLPVRIQSPLVLILWLALAIVGFAYQARIYRSELETKAYR